MALVITVFAPLNARGDEPLADCRPDVAVSGVDGGDPAAVAPPDGTTDRAEASISLELSHVGADCPAVLDSPPVLVGAWVGPEIGHARQFTMMVTYADADNDPPTAIFFRLDDRDPSPMSFVQMFPSDEDFRDGVLYAGGFEPDFFDGGDQIALGPHVTRFYAENLKADAQPVAVDAPFVVEETGSAVRAPNPTNRFLIHPIANGPTLVPPLEVLPPLAPLAGDPANGIYSYTFELGPLAGRGDLRYSAGSSSPGLLDRYLEGPVGAGFDLSGSARTVRDAHTGAQGVELGAEGEAPLGDVHGTLLAFPGPGFAFVQTGGFRVWHNGTNLPATAMLRIGVLLDFGREGDADACVAKAISAETGDVWAESVVGLLDVYGVFQPDCASPLGQPRSATLKELHDDPVFGLATYLHAELALIEAGAWPPDARLLLDDLNIGHTFSNTRSDIDICLYRVEPEAPVSTFTPVLCESDIGPSGGPIPQGATHANLWTHTMEPVLDDNLLPRRAYLEPVSVGFSYSKFVPYEVAFAVLELPPPRATGAVEVGEDLDGDGVLDAGEPILGRVEGIPDAEAPAAVGPFVVPLAGRADGVYAFVARYVDGLGLSDDAGFLVQRFVNDAPTAGLSATTFAGKKKIEFHLSGGDADDAQGTTAATFGGLASWELSFGDGETDGGAFPMPLCLVHRYQRQGEYEAVLTLTDRAGAPAVASVLVDVGDTVDGSCA